MTTTRTYTLGYCTEAGGSIWTWTAADGGNIQIIEMPDGGYYLYTVAINVEGNIIETSTWQADTLENAKAAAEWEYMDAVERV